MSGKDQYVPGSWQNVTDADMDTMVERAKEALSALSVDQRLRLCALLMNKVEWSEEVRKWED